MTKDELDRFCRILVLLNDTDSNESLLNTIYRITDLAFPTRKHNKGKVTNWKLTNGDLIKAADKCYELRYNKRYEG